VPFKRYNKKTINEGSADFLDELKVEMSQGMLACLLWQDCSDTAELNFIEIWYDMIIRSLQQQQQLHDDLDTKHDRGAAKESCFSTKRLFSAPLRIV